MASAVTAGLVFKLVIQRVEAAFSQRVEQLYDGIEHTVRDNEAILEGFSAFLSAIEYADRASASRYAKQILAHYPHVFRLEVILSVKPKELREFVSRQRRTWLPEFKVKPVDFGPTKTDADYKAHNFHPIIFVEPDLPGNKRLIGVDLETSEFLRHILYQSLKTGKPAATTPYELVDGPRGYALIQPVPSRTSRILPNLKQAFVMLEVNADQMSREIETLSENLDIKIRHERYAGHDPEGLLIDIPAPPAHQLEIKYLPRLGAEKKISRTGQPYVLKVVKQMTWDDFNVPLVIIVGSASLLTLMFLLLLVFSYYKREKQRKQSEDRLLYMATHDALTGLPNRTLLNDRFSQAITRAQRRSTPFSVMFIDLNDFKLVNDTYGHEIGDLLLKTLGNLLHDCIRQEDTLCRISGDEFVILLENTSCPNAERVGWKIHDKTLKPVIIQDIELYLSLSLGIATYPEDGHSMSTLLKKADERMYQAKTSRRKTGEIQNCQTS